MHPKDLMTLAQEGKGLISYGRRFTASALNSMFQSEVSDAPGSPPTRISAQEEFPHARTVGNRRTVYLPVGAHSVSLFQLDRTLNRSNSNHKPRPNSSSTLRCNFSSPCLHPGSRRPPALPVGLHKGPDALILPTLLAILASIDSVLPDLSDMIGRFYCFNLKEIISQSYIASQ